MNLLNNCLSHLGGVCEVPSAYGAQEESKAPGEKESFAAEEHEVEKGRIAHLLLCVTWRALEVGKLCEDN